MTKPRSPAHKQLSLERFTWNKETLTLSTFASDLGQRNPLYQLYLDACDEGISIRSHKTNKVEVFCLVREETNSDNDLVAWHFNPVDAACPVKHVVIFND